MLRIDKTAPEAQAYNVEPIASPVAGASRLQSAHDSMKHSTKPWVNAVRENNMQIEGLEIEIEREREREKR